MAPPRRLLGISSQLMVLLYALQGRSNQANDPSVNCREVPLYGKFQKMASNKLKISRDLVNGYVNSSMRNREGKIDHK
jgi:hypothetical protein